jgi:ABC-type histidine transport system ATPase subunit
MMAGLASADGRSSAGAAISVVGLEKAYGEHAVLRGVDLSQAD